MRRSRAGEAWIIAVILSLFAAAPAAAQDDKPGAPTETRPAKPAKPTPKPDTKAQADEAARLQSETFEALRRHDFEKAEEALRKLIEVQPANFVHYYNLACVRARRGDPADAGELLVKAVEHGFCDIRLLESDTDLNTVRNDANYRQLIDNWTAVLSARLDANIKQAKLIFKNGKYKESRDDHLRLSYLTCMDDRAVEEAKVELARLMEWANTSVMPGVLDAGELARDPYVLMVLPSKTDFNRWSSATFGASGNNGISQVGGSYEHDLKRLVAMDLGGTLRHEFFHSVHWRSCTHLNQTHPIWIQEGICCLVEDFDIDATGKLSPSTSWRTNSCKRMDRAHNLLTLEKFCHTDYATFQGSRRLGMYAEARGVFLFFWQTGKLKDWYQTYTTRFKEDPSGVKAIEEVYGKPIAEVNKDFLTWLRALKDVPEDMRQGMASLGVEVENGEGEGPRVVSMGRRDRKSTLQLGDIILSIAGRPTHDLPELLRILGEYQPHDIVEVKFRRGRLLKSEEVPLDAFGG